MPGLKDWLQLARIPAVFTALSNILAAFFISGADVALLPQLIALLVASASLYSAGMVLNDCFDYAEDARERPGRPLPSGRISRRKAWIVGFALLLIGIIAGFQAGRLSGLIALGIAALVLLYDGLAKHYVSGSVVMGGCRYLNWLLGLSVAGWQVAWFWVGLPIFIYIASVTWLSRQETQASDPNTVWGCGLGIALSSIMMLILVQHLGGHWWGLLGMLPALGFLLRRLMITHAEYTPANIQNTIRILIMSVIPLDALMVAFLGPWWGVVPVLILFLPGKVIARHLYVT